MNKNPCGKLSFSTVIQLAAPHTWPASVMPVLLGAAIACAMRGRLGAAELVLTLAAAVLLQSAVNTLNDYSDFVSGLDTAENCPDSSDAALAYGLSSPGAALALGLLFLFLAGLAGGVLLLISSAALSIYALIGLAAILLYTVPLFRFSRLPLGELLSGGAMGGVLCFASFHAQYGAFLPRLLYLCLPALIMIGCIMLVNNTADIEKDRAGGRRTLPSCLGRERAHRLLAAAILLSAVLAAAFVCILFPGGIWLLPVMLIAMLTDLQIWGLFRTPPTQQCRVASMRGILSACIKLCGFYIAAVFIHAVNI